MLELFVRGGVFMYPILLCSVIAASILIERLIFLAGTGRRQRKFLRQVKQIRGPNQLQEVGELAKAIDSPASNLLRCAIANGEKYHAERQVVIERAGSNTVSQVEKGLGGLQTIAQISPLLGLLGTVAGMIKAFMVIERIGGQVDPSTLAGGIWEALLTTGFGLTVAIPVLALAYYLQGRADEVVGGMKDVAAEFPELFATPGGQQN